ncbi:unnamed protein product, partial [Soboliphyme baturini]|uniref:Basement membrane proteoglycan n=1 Tax=Soboliphyme baturini TaxID=241478 RepID=A0A183IQK5_9BILA
DPGEFVEVFPPEQTIREGDDVTFECHPRNIHHRVAIQWLRRGGSLPANAIINRGQLTIPHAKAADAGVYICKVSSIFLPKQAEVRLSVESGHIAEYVGPSHCLETEATCQNGQCVKREYVCDGEKDCEDGSDEFNCPEPKACEPNEFKCDNKLCVQKLWICDGDDDCGDGSDERNCGTRAPGEPCSASQFQCRTGDQCIAASFQCDGQNDCADGSDEIGCAPPICVQPPVREITVRCGETVVLECKAVGVPVPFINWRLNWGNTCGPPRCIQKSDRGYGVLTITDGAYTCEAINNKGRILATPDAILTVQCQETGACSAAGTAGENVQGKKCLCKHHVTGEYCNQCIQGTFYLNRRNPYGCIQCFCSGVIRSAFSPGGPSVTVSDFLERSPEATPNIVFQPRGTISMTGSFDQVLYWRLPQEFLGNKLTSYGGYLTFTMQYSCIGGELDEPLIVIRGNEITLVHRSRTPLKPDHLNTVRIEIFETYFEREDGQPATREHLLMALADLDSLMIRASHCYGQRESSLGDVSLTIAVDRDTQQERAWEVEQCQCPPGYQGLSCEDCAPGYQRTGGGLYLGLCEPIGGGGEPPAPVMPERPETPEPVRPEYGCNPAGSLSPYADASGNCRCKQYATGRRCDVCTPDSFNLDEQNPEGCLRCFCSGVTRDCSSSDYYVQQVTLQTQFVQDITEKVTVRTADLTNFFEAKGQSYVDSGRNLAFSAFLNAPPEKALYWALPSLFLNNKVTSYGGSLDFTINFRGYGADDVSPMVVMRGNDMSIFYHHETPVPANVDYTVHVPLIENHWTREDNQPVTREHLMTVLSDLHTVLLKMTQKKNMETISLKEVSMDVATEEFSNQKAVKVELCHCPQGYAGTSCEACAPGYTRIGGGLYLGQCQPCSCHGHATDCDSSSGVCKDCQDNTEGDHCERCKPGYEGDARRGTPYDCNPVHARPACECHYHSPIGCDDDGRCLRCEHNTEGTNCERCKPGYYGDATVGTPFDCRPCPCPGGSECYLDANGQPTCRSCPAGYTGPTCSECAPGYARDPSDPSRCKPIAMASRSFDRLSDRLNGGDEFRKFRTAA